MDFSISNYEQKLTQAASTANSKPLESARLQIEAEYELKAQTKAVEAKDEALGSVLDLYA